MTDRDGELLAAARRAQANSYSPYSRFRVGAALLCESGVVISGCNVESASFGATICAERSALAAAVAAGHRRFAGLALVSDAAEPVAPCGICRQALSEFAPDLPIISEGSSGARATWSLRHLLPQSFGPKALEGR